MRRGLIALALACALPATTSAQGLSFTPGAAPTGAYRFTARWDTYAHGQTATSGAAPAVSSTTITAWTNVLSAQLDLGAMVLRTALPLAYARRATRTTVLGTSTESSDDQAELGNVGLEGLASIDLGSPEQRLLIGGGIALPTATDQRRDAFDVRGLLVRQVAWRTSFRNAAAWAEQSFTLWPSIEYRYAGPWVLVSVQGSIPIFLPTHSDVGGPLARGMAEVMLALDVSGAVRIEDVVDVGASLMTWAMPSGAGYHPGGGSGTPDLGQVAASIFVRTDDALDLPVGGGAEMIFNLDNEWGPTGDDGKFWGFRIFVSGRFDG